jgi:hypothetical protein
VTDALLVTYGSGDRVTFIELASPADPTIKGVHLLHRDLGEVLYRLHERGVSVAPDRDGAEVPGLGELASTPPPVSLRESRLVSNLRRSSLPLQMKQEPLVRAIAARWCYWKTRNEPCNV